MEQGRYHNLSNDDYHNQSNSLSRSQLCHLLDSPRKFYEKHILKTFTSTTSINMMIGTLFHTLVLEPQNFNNEYVHVEKFNRATKSGKAIYEAQIAHHGHKTWITDATCPGMQKISCADYNRTKEMVEALKLHPFYKIIKNGGVIENSFFWQESFEGQQVTLKTRPDFYNDDVIVDIKTTISAKRDDFKRSIIKYGYHIQAAMMIDGLSACTGKNYNDFVFFVIEKNKPHIAQAFQADNEIIEYGRSEYRRAIRGYINMKKQNKWPVDFPINDGLNIQDNKFSLLTIDLPNYLQSY